MRFWDPDATICLMCESRLWARWARACTTALLIVCSLVLLALSVRQAASVPLNHDESLSFAAFTWDLVSQIGEPPPTEYAVDAGVLACVRQLGGFSTATKHPGTRDVSRVYAGAGEPFSKRGCQDNRVHSAQPQSVGAELLCSGQGIRPCPRFQYKAVPPRRCTSRSGASLAWSAHVRRVGLTALRLPWVGVAMAMAFAAGVALTALMMLFIPQAGLRLTAFVAAAALVPFAASCATAMVGRARNDGAGHTNSHKAISLECRFYLSLGAAALALMSNYPFLNYYVPLLCVGSWMLADAAPIVGARAERVAARLAVYFAAGALACAVLVALFSLQRAGELYSVEPLVL